MEWWVVFHHATHTHPFLPASPGNSGTFTIPRTGELASDVFYRIFVRAIGDNGSADTAFTDVLPRLVTFTVATDPAGLSVALDDQPTQTPISIVSVVGMEWPIDVPAGQVLAGTEYEFASWSVGGPANQTLVMPDTSLTLTAHLRDVGVANTPPAVAIASPPAGGIVTAGTTTTIAASATDANGAVVSVEFFAGTVKLGTDTDGPPFSLSWLPTGTGQRTLTARATDNRGAYTVSSPVVVTVQAAGGGDGLAPVVSLTAPTEGTRDLSGSVTVTADATDNTGVASVEFAVDGFRFATDDAPPYVGTLASTDAFASGAHTIGARAIDAAGNVSDWSFSTVTFAGTVALPAGFSMTTYVGGFGDILTAAIATPDGRVLVCEQSGKLRVVKNGTLLPQPAVDVMAQHDGERGLVGVTLHPEFATNHLVYLYYTASSPFIHNRIVRYILDGDVVIPSSATTIAELPILGAAKHNGGAMAFSGDGKLYVAVGDNSNGANAPSLEIPFGKILRFNSDGTIPSDNPFVAQTTGINRAIWARGLRNPFTLAVEPGTNRMHINDVGNATWEEINIGRAGADYGWPTTEGPTTNPAYDPPLLAIRHENSPTLFDSRAIVGAGFYHPQTPSFGAEYVGSYFFADYVYGWIYRLDAATGRAGAFAQTGGAPTGLLVMPDGSLLVMTGTSISRISRQSGSP